MKTIINILKYFLILFLCFFSQNIFASYSQTVTTAGGFTVKVTGGNQQQLNEWVDHAKNSTSASKLLQDLRDGAAGHGAALTSNTPTSASCANGAGLQLIGWGNTGGGSSTSSSSSSSSQPVVSTKSSSSSCSYISSWSPNWSNCEVSSSWSSEGAINCEQENTWSPNYTSGTKTCVTTYVDGVASGSPSCSSTCGSNKNRPATQYDTKTFQLSLASPNSENCNGVFANNNSSCKFTISLDGSTNGNKSIIGISGLSIKNIFDQTKEPADRINGGFNASNNNALNFSNVTASIKGSGFSYYIEFDGIKSRSPFTSNNGKVEFQIQDPLSPSSYATMNISNIFYDFKKPFVGKLEASFDGLTWGEKPEIGTSMYYKLQANQVDSNLISPLSSINMQLTSDRIHEYGDGIQVDGIDIDSMDYDSGKQRKFSARINTSEDATSLTNTPGIQILPTYIGYTLDGHSVKYELSQDTPASDITPIILSGNAFRGVQVVGSFQAIGKNELTGQGENFSDISKSEIRSQIRENAYSYIKNMTPGTILNGVKYVEGDITISGNLSDYETLIVKDGNVIINSDLNTTGNTFGIIVLKDGYDSLNGASGKGNIYVGEDVTYIDAVLYADGAIVSANSIGNPYLIDSSLRTQHLQKQLVIKGSIFTRNTIGGAILAGGDYTLPGGGKTSDFDKAMVYDLNYVRRGNFGWDGTDTNNDGNNYNLGYSDPFVIIYNPSIQTNPPKLFSK